jgi:cell division protein FtsB
MLNRHSVRVLLLTIVAIGVASCGTAVEETAKYKSAIDEKVAVEASLASEQSKSVELQAKLESATKELTETKASYEAKVADLSQESTRLSSEIKALREQYDPTILAEAQRAWDGEVARACAVASNDITSPIASITTYSSSMRRVGDSAALVAAVEACAAPERQKSAEQRRAERLANCAVIDGDAVQKDPDSTKGQCFVAFMHISQYDSATGKCSFQGNLASSGFRYSYEYKVRAQVGIGTSVVLQRLQTDCPELTDIDEDDFVKVWLTGIGAYSYSTTLNGTNTVPAFTIERIELVRKA